MKTLKLIVPALLGVSAALVGCETGKTTLQSPLDGDIAPSLSQLATAKDNTVSNQAQLQIEPVALFSGPMPTGVAVSRDNRIFVNFPRWADPVEYTVAEITNGHAVSLPQ